LGSSFQGNLEIQTKESPYLFIYLFVALGFELRASRLQEILTSEEALENLGFGDLETSKFQVPGIPEPSW
jgi:hypothetical protein